MPGKIPVRPKRRFLRARLWLEDLEARLVPATLVNPTTLTYLDSAGILATVNISVPVFTAATINSVFLFDTGSVNQSNATRQQLQKLDLTPLGSSASGAALTITAQAGFGGVVNLVNAGFINATGINLGSVSVQGDLGKIDAGAGSASTPGLVSLTVQSMGQYGASTQAAGGDLVSAVNGALNSLSVHTNLVRISLSVAGRLGPVTVGGSLLGGIANQSGFISSSGSMGTVSIAGNVVAGSGSNSGELTSQTSISSVHIGGSLQGGAGQQSGTILCSGPIGPVQIVHDMIGGLGAGSAQVFTPRTLGNVTIGGKLLGGAGVGSAVLAANGGIGFVQIAGDVQAGPNASSSAVIKSENGNIAGVSIGGSLVGTGPGSGAILSPNGGKLGPIEIGGNLAGGSGAGSGSINGPGGIARLIVSKAIMGSTGAGSGAVTSLGSIGTVLVLGNIQGGTGSGSGGIFTKGVISNITVGGSVLGSGLGSGFIEGTGGVGLVHIVGDLKGGARSGYSGYIKSEYGSIAGVTIGGSFIGQASGFILSNNGGQLGPVRITGSIVGGSGPGSASINGTGGIASLSVGGAIMGGAGIDSAQIISKGDIGPVQVGNGISGGAGSNSGAIFTTRSIASISVIGSLLGGGDGSGSIQGVSGIGQVQITGDVKGGPNATYSGIIKSEYSSIASVTIGGSLIGTGLNSGWIISNHGGPMGPVQITGGIFGGSGPFSGSINGTGGIANLTVGQAIVGSDGQGSGAVISDGPVGNITIGGNLQGGAGTSSGAIFAKGGLGNVTVMGSLLGDGDGSANIQTNGNLGTVLITGDVQGGANASYSGVVKSEYGSITSVTIDGSIVGTGFRSGWIISNHGGPMGPVQIGGGITGGIGGDSGSVRGTGGIASVTVGKAILGSDGSGSGAIISDGLVGNITIGGNLQGGAGAGSGAIFTSGNLSNVTVIGSLVGGSGSNSGTIQANGNIGAVMITGDVTGGLNASFSGYIKSEYGNITSVTLGGSLIGTGGFSGLILANHGGQLGPVSIAGNVQGGSNAGSSAAGFTGCIQAGHIVSINIGGSIISGMRTGAGTLDGSGAIRAEFDIGSITVTGSLMGNSTTPVLISAQGQMRPTTTDVALVSLTVHQQVLYTNILAGYETHGLPEDGDAQIGTILVDGNWTASNIAAGMEPGTDGVFGTHDDFRIPHGVAGILSDIASIVIGGMVQGTPTSVSATDHFGFVAALIKSLQVSGKIIALNPGPHNDVVSLGATGDVTLREV